WPLVWLGLDECRRIVGDEPDSIVGWKLLGQTEIRRDPAPQPSPRYRLPFNPVDDLSLVRATYALRRAREVGPDQITTLMTLDDAYARRGMNEAALQVVERLDALAARHPAANDLLLLEPLAKKRESYLSELGAAPPMEWRNMAELDRLVTALLANGRAQ